jgi:hypothetical protein
MGKILIGALVVVDVGLFIIEIAALIYWLDRKIRGPVS